MAYWTHGFPVRRLAHPQGGDTILVEIGEREYALTEEAFKRVLEASSDTDSFVAAVKAELARSAEEWRRERGPDSPLGRGVEAGTPPTDHSSEPTC